MGPPYALTSEQKMLKETVKRMALEKIGPRAAEIDETGEFPGDVYEELKGLGLFGLVFPGEYGGSDAGMLSAAVVLEEIGMVCSSSAMICASPIVAGKVIFEKGNLDQKMKYLPPMASGEKLASFSLTELDLQSGAVRTTCQADKKGGQYIINGRECFVALADMADLLIVFANTGQGGAMDTVGAFVVEKSIPGWAITRVEKTLGTRAAHACEIVFEGCVIPEENRIGDEGDGLSVAMRAMEINCVAIASRVLGLAQSALNYALKYSLERIQFGRPISSFQGIQFILADMAMEIEAGRSLLYGASSEMDRGGNEGHILGLTAKCFIADTAMKVTTDAVQVLGGYGYMKDYPVERMMRDAKMSQLVGGTNQVQRILLAREVLK